MRGTRKERRVGNTFAKGEIVSVGGSWIGERGFGYRLYQPSRSVRFTWAQP